MVIPRDDQLVEKLWPDFVGRSEGIPIWKLAELGSHFDPDDILMLMHFDDHRLIEKGGTQGNYFVTTRGEQWLNWIGANSPSTRGSMILVPSLWPGLPALKTVTAETNLVPNPVLGTGTGSWNATGGSAIGQVQTESIYSAYSLRVVAVAAVGSGTRTSSIVIAPSTDYTASILFLGDAGINYKIRLYGIGAAATFAQTNFVGTGAWQFVTVSGTSAAADNTAYLYIEMNEATASTFYIDAVNLVQADYHTHPIFGDGGDGHTWAGTPGNSQSNRTANSIQGNNYTGLVDGNDEWSVMMWVQAPRDNDDTWPQNNNALFDVSDGSNNNRVFLLWESSTEEFRISIDGANIVRVPYAFNRGDWLHLVFNMDFANNTFSISINGVLEDSVTDTLASPTGYTNMNFGSNYAEGGQSDFVFAECVIMNRVVTDVEIANVYSKNQPLIDAYAVDKELNVGMIAYKTANQSINDATATTIQIDTVDYNEHLILDTANNYILITQPGWYHISGGIAWQSDAVGYRRIALTGQQMGTAAGLAFHSTNAINGQATYQTISSVEYLIPGDFVRLQGYQTSGGALSTITVARYSNYLRVVKIRNVFEATS